MPSLSSSSLKDISKLSNEEIILILERLDPESLWGFCKAYRHVHSIVIGVQALRYQLELGMTGMKDGPARHASGPPVSRLELLLRYKSDWPSLSWSCEDVYKFVENVISYGISGGFLYQVTFNGLHHTVKIYELPSVRVGRTRAAVTPLTYESHLLIRDTLIDRSQELLVTSRFFCSATGFIQIQFDFRNLWTFGVHSKASAPTFQYDSGSVDPNLYSTWEVCGPMLAVAVRSNAMQSNLLVTLVIIGWRTRVRRVWPRILDSQLIDSDRILIIHRDPGSSPLLRLWDITDLPNARVICEFELPAKCRNALIRFNANTSPRFEAEAPPEAMFYADPAKRIVVFTSTVPSVNGEPASRDLIVINESYFKSLSFGSRSQVLWKEWSKYCLVRDLGPSNLSATCVGRRIVLHEPQAPHVRTGAAPVKSRTGLRLITFNPLTDVSVRPKYPATWSWIGSRTNMTPVETTKTIPFYGNVEAVTPTEDNIVLFMAQTGGRQEPPSKVVNVLTFA